MTVLLYHLIDFINNICYYFFMEVDKINWRFVSAVIILAFSLRFAFNLYYGFNDSPGIDGIVLDKIAYNLATGHGYSNFPDIPTAKKPPAFILIISLIYKIFGMHNYTAVRILLIVFSSITPALVYLIARNTGGGAGEGAEEISRIAALLTAFSPLLIYNSWWFLSNTFMYFLLALGVYLIILPKKDSNILTFAFGGLFLGLTTLSLQYGTVFYFPLAFIWSYFVYPEKWLRTALIITIAMIIPVSIWMARNYKVYQRFIYNNTESGVRFWGGNNPNADGNWTPWIGSARFYSKGIKPGWENASNWIELSDKMGTPFQDLVLNKKDALTEPEINDRYFSHAIQWIKNNPSNYIKLLFKKFLILWHPFSRHSVSPFLTEPFRNIAFLFELFILPFFFWGIISSLAHWKNYLFPYLLIIHQIVIALYHSGDLQQRLRAGNYILIFSALGMYSLNNYIHKSKKEIHDKQ
ncbi:MAG: glycosyltransferase family 39 protein [bacterium]|nr:glycosyltransferase family 39 protein [bacterium]